MPKYHAPSNDPVVLAFSREVRQARTLAGLSTYDAAARAGLNDSAIIRWIESGHGCQLLTAVRLARVFGISLDSLYDIRQDTAATQGVS